MTTQNVIIKSRVLYAFTDTDNNKDYTHKSQVHFFASLPSIQIIKSKFKGFKQNKIEFIERVSL